MESSSSWARLSDDTRARGFVKHGMANACMLFAVGAACFIVGVRYGHTTSSEQHLLNSPMDTSTELLGMTQPRVFRQPIAPQRVSSSQTWQPLSKTFSPLIQKPWSSWQPQSPLGNGRGAFNPLTVRSSDKEDGHQPPQGHQAPTMPEMSDEDMAILNKYREHQQNAARLSNADEVRTLMEYSNGYGVLSTNSQQYDGFPTGSVVGFAQDDQGYPFMVFSSMSAHTGDVLKDGRISLTVLAKDFKGAAEGRCVLIGEMGKLPDDQKATYRDIYMKRHPEAFWIDFGDFSYFKVNSIKSVRFIGGFARAGSITGEEYLAAKPDPVAAYASHVMKHMNDDHSDATGAIVNHYVGVPVKDPKLVGMDSLGMTVKATMDFASGGEAKIRIPWDAPDTENQVTDRKAIKNVIVRMTQNSAPQPAASSSSSSEEK